jgi:3-methyl-2-oxobutanoate hydroxymethyltransferase
MAGLTESVPKFVRRYADVRAELARAAHEFAEDVRSGRFPTAEHEYA